MLRGLAASPGVYEGPARLVAGPSEFGRIVQGDVLLTPATTEAFNILLPLARRDRDRQRRPPLPLGDRRARVRDPGRRRDARSDRAHRRRDARARRRHGRRSHGARVKEVVPLAEASETSIFGSKAVGLGDAIRDGLPVPPGVALSGPVVEAVAVRRRAGHRAGRRGGQGPARRRSRCARRRSTRTARTPASPGSTSRCSTSRRPTRCRRRCARSGGRRTRTRPSPTASASDSSPARASASSCRRCSIPTSPA